MIRVLAAVWLLALGLAVSGKPQVEPRLETGDLVFQTSRSAQSRAIQEATGSPYSHVGMVEVTPAGTFVIEAIQPVSRTRWTKWRMRGEGGWVLVKRPAGLDGAARQKAVAWARRQLGKPYDLRFGWDDGKLYCSELVYKAFERGAGVVIGRRQELHQLRLDRLGPELQERYGGRIPAVLELVTPASLAADEKLETVWSTYPAAPAAKP